MMDEITYRVLWIDDKYEELIQGAQLKAERYNIELVGFDNWEEAWIHLTENFGDYSAIILDADCVLKPNEDTSAHFISNVVAALKELFGKKQQYLPWYILSAGTMKHFDFVVEGAKSLHQSEDWGDMLYLKDNPQSVELLYENIRKVAEEQSNNVVLFRHKDVFEYLGRGNLIDERAREYMLKMLGTLYFPEENVRYEYEGNPLRKVLEYIFRSARKQGLLSPYCFDKDDHVNLTYSSLYLKGETVKLNGKELDVEGTVRWGNKKDCVFPDNVANIVWGILGYANVDSHTYEVDDKPYQVDESSKDLFFGYVLQLCYVIKCYGKFVKDHPDIKKNQCMQVEEVKHIVDSLMGVHGFEGKVGVVEKDDSNNYHCLGCVLPYTSAQFLLGKEVRLKEVVNNQNKQTKQKYPLYAKFEVVK